MTTVIANDVYIVNNAFTNNKKIVNVSCNNTKWENTDMYEAFQNCSNLQRVNNINENVTNMRGAFYECRNLVNVSEIPDCATDIGYLFYNCQNLTSAPTIPNSVTVMDSAFQGCSNLTNAPIIGNSVVDMQMTFGSCSNLVNVPSLENCTNLFTLDYCFESCSSLVNTPTVPNSLFLMHSTYGWCDNLTNVTSFSSSAYDLSGVCQYSPNVSSIPNIPANVSILSEAFYECGNLTGNIYVESPFVYNAEYMFENTSTTKNVYIPYTYQENITRNLYCWYWEDSEDPTINCKYYTDIDLTAYHQYFQYFMLFNPDGTLREDNVNYGTLFYGGEDTNDIELEGVWNGQYGYRNPVRDTTNDVTCTYLVGTNTLTYNAFINAGYNDEGDKDGVYLKDINGGSGTEVDVTDYEYQMNNTAVDLTKYIGVGGDVVIPNV